MKFRHLLLTLCFAVSLSSLRAQPAPATNAPVAPTLRTNAAIVPVPRPQEAPQKRLEELNRRVQAAAGEVDLVFLGDSITQGWEGNGKNVWQRYYASRKPLNLGIGGDRTQHVLWRLDHGDSAGLKPKVVVLMIGTNNSNRDDHPPGEILEGVTAIVRRLREKWPATKILLLGIFPRGATFSEQRGKLLQVNQALAKLDDGRNVFFLEIGAQFIEADGSITKAIMPDALHFSERGYELWAAALEPKLAELLGAAPNGAASSAAGEWIWKMKGPNEEEVQGPLVLKVEGGGKVTGVFHTDAGRTMPIKEGSQIGDQLKLTVVRDRPQGGEMVYQMSGTVGTSSIAGSVTTEFNGQPVTQPWSAKRK
jgi:lysophospholipase L1-like esterase